MKIQQSSIRTLFIWPIVCSMIAMMGCKPINPFVYTKIGDNVTLDENPETFVFEQPFKPTKQVNELCFIYVESMKVERISEPPLFADGTRLLIKSTVADSKGREWELTEITRNGPELVCYRHTNDTFWYGISNADIIFTRLEVSSNKRIELKRIEWRSFNAWDMK